MGTCYSWGAPFAVAPWGRHVRLNQGEGGAIPSQCGWYPKRRGGPPDHGQCPLGVVWIFFLEQFVVFLLDLAPTPPRARLDLCDVYVSSNVRRIINEPQYRIMYTSGQQPGRAGGPGKSPGPPNGNPKGERTTGWGMSAG